MASWRDSFQVKPRLNRSGSSNLASAGDPTVDSNQSLLELERKTHQVRRNEDNSIFSGTSFAENTARDNTSQGFLRHVTFGSTFALPLPGKDEEEDSATAAAPPTPTNQPLNGLTLDEFFPNAGDDDEEDRSRTSGSGKHRSLFSRTLAEPTRALSVRYRKSQAAPAAAEGGGGGHVSFAADTEDGSGNRMNRSASSKSIGSRQKSIANQSVGGGDAERPSLSTRLRNISVSMRPKSHSTAAANAASSVPHVTIGEIDDEKDRQIV